MKRKRKLWVTRSNKWLDEIEVHNLRGHVFTFLCEREFRRFVGPLKPGETRELIVKLGKAKKK